MRVCTWNRPDSYEHVTYFGTCPNCTRIRMDPQLILSRKTLLFMQVEEMRWLVFQIHQQGHVSGTKNDLHALHPNQRENVFLNFLKRKYKQVQEQILFHFILWATTTTKELRAKVPRFSAEAVVTSFLTLQKSSPVTTNKTWFTLRWDVVKQFISHCATLHPIFLFKIPPNSTAQLHLITFPWAQISWCLHTCHPIALTRGWTACLESKPGKCDGRVNRWGNSILNLVILSRTTKCR